MPQKKLMIGMIGCGCIVTLVLTLLICNMERPSIYIARASSIGSVDINAKDHGATGDGITDDTEAINVAFEELGKNDGVVFFPPGSYSVEEPAWLSRELAKE